MGFIFYPAEFSGLADCLKYLALLSKKQLVECAKWLGVPWKTAETRAEMLVLVRDKLKHELAKAEHSGSESESQSPVNALSDSKEEKEYNLICKRIELHKMEFEENERVRCHELERVKLKIEMARLQGANLISSPKDTYQDWFNIGAALKLVPVFDEKDVPEFFKAFERVASRLSWPTEMWTVLIQCRLVGKAMRVYNALEEEVARDYQKVKALILKSYDLAAEAYCLQFLNYTKHPAQSFVEFARVTEEQFDDWLKSRQIDLRYVIGMWVESKEVLLPLKFLLIKTSQVGGNNRYNGNRSCFWYNKPGHFQNQCNARRMYLERNYLSPVALASDKSEISSCSPVDRPVVGSSSVKFFRDTGSARTLVLKRVLNGFEKYTGNFVLLGGFLDSVMSAPLVNVRMSFPGYDRVTELAVVDSLPILGIDGILGNDMLNSEGRKLFPILSVNASPVAVMTRSASKPANLLDVDRDDELMLSSVELDVLRPGPVESSCNEEGPMVTCEVVFSKQHK
ncbi:uncharacterized protein [Palaemon carinicauda]|uniref:uncharacterized protein n=1 Tax=Palaemon carinicauda TaxID=392227 RepID=UPI0035B61AB8